MKLNKKFLQVGITIAISSVVAVGLLLVKLNNIAKVENSNASISDEPCSEAGFRSSHVFPGCKEPKRECDLKGDKCYWKSNGKTQGTNENGFQITCSGQCVRKTEDKPKRTPKPTKTPKISATPTVTPTVTPIVTPEQTSSVTPTPTAPPVLGVTAPPRLPKTGSSLNLGLSLFGVGALGVYLFRKFRLV